METFEDLEWTQARITHSALQQIATETDKKLNGCETATRAGIKMNAPERRATVAVYSPPAERREESNMATSSVVLFA
jgi:hypothetical protein